MSEGVSPSGVSLSWESPLLIAGVCDPFNNIWTPEALRAMAAKKPEEMRYDEQARTLYVRQGVNVRYVDSDNAL